MKEKGKWFPGLFSLKGEVAVITGGASGLGRAIALGLAEAGSKVAIVDVSAEGAEQAAEEVKQMGGKAIAMQGDVTRMPKVEAMAQEVLEDWGRIDILVNSAGVVFRSSALEYPEREWDRVLVASSVIRGVLPIWPARGEWCS